MIDPEIYGNSGTAGFVGYIRGAL